MPLTKKGQTILAHMMETYRDKGGAAKAKSVFYAMANSGKLKGVHT